MSEPKALNRRTGRRRTLPALLALNGLLLMLLGVVTFAPPADAQYRSRGSYTMAAGGVNGSNSDAVYIVDTANLELIALTFDPNAKSMTGVGYRNLAADVASLGRGGANR